MNRVYKVIYSKARQCYMVVSELAKRNQKNSQTSTDHRTPALARVITATIAAGALMWGSAPGVSWAAADTTPGSGNGVAIGTGSNAPKVENVAIGKGATISYSNGVKNATGDIVVGNGANINNYASQGGSIAIGKNAKVENMAGGGEASFAFGQTTFSGGWLSSSRIPADPSKVVGSIAIGDNTFARTGSTMIGSHNYKGELGDTTVDSASTRTDALNVYATTIGANSFSNGAFTTNTGAYNIISSDYNGGRLANPVKNMGAIITGALNSIESKKEADYYSGIANSIVGTANRTSNSNGSLIFGAGNEIKNSITDISAPSSGGDSAKSLQDSLMKAVQNSKSGGATLVIGGGNKASYTQKVQILGVNNTVTGTEELISMYNMVNGYQNTVTGASHVKVLGQNVTINKGADSNTVIGDYRTVADNQTNNVIIGNADEKNPITTEKKETVILGYKANATVNGGVAIGSGSIAVTPAEVYGWDPKTNNKSSIDSKVWKSSWAAVSIGDGTHTRQITNLAAGFNDTDAVNVAQLKAISSTMNTDIAASKTHFYSVKSTDAKAKNYNNDGATAANALAAGVGANADKASAVAIGDTAYAGSANGVAIGTGSWIRSSDGKPNANGGDVAIGQDSHVDSYVNQGGSIALGQNARVENMYGNTEKSWALGQTKFDDKNIPLNPGNEAGGVAIGRNSFARTGSLMVGSHMYKGAIADIDEVDGTDSQKLRDNFNNINMTTLGTNSFNNGTFATVTGAYSATTAKKKIQNFAATVDGSLNSIESYKDAADNSGVASSIVGTANRIANSNNTTILGAGNEVTNSLTDITAPTEGGDSAKALQDTLKGKLQQDEKGAIVVSGIGNIVDSSHGVSVLGSRNAVKTTDNIQLLGDNREVTGANGSVIIGSADSKMTTSVTDATILGHNANVEKTGGVALGAGSVASREAGVAGYDPATKTDSTDSSATWKATDAAVSVGKADGTMTRQITGVAAGTNATDAVNVAQLQKALAGAKDGNDTLKSGTDALKLDGNKLSMNIQDTAGNTVSGSVDLSKFAQAVDTNTTYTLTGQENKDNNTTTITLEDNNGNKNNVTVATKDTRNTVKAGENVTLGITNNTDGSHEYTVNVKADGKVEAGSTKIVSGDTVYNETRVKQDGTYVKVSNTAGENLSALDNQVTSNTQNINYLNGRVGELGDRINKVGAGAAALAALHPLDFDPEDKWDFAAGVGNYRNATAAAVGLFYRPNERTMFNLGWTMGDNRNMVNGGFSVKFGKSNKYIKYSKAEMAAVIDNQSREIAELKAKDAQNAKDNAEMKAEIEALKKQVEALAAKK